jgi:uncharacterized membrane protein
VGTAGPAPGGYAAASATVAPAASAGMSENVASALCYILGLLTGIIFLVLAPYNQNRTIRFHAFQSIFFHVGTIILWVLYMILGAILSTATHMLSTLVLFPLWLLICLGLFCTWIYLLYTAYSGKKVVLPIVGPLAEKQA